MCLEIFKSNKRFSLESRSSPIKKIINIYLVGYSINKAPWVSGRDCVVQYLSYPSFRSPLTQRAKAEGVPGHANLTKSTANMF